MKLNTLVVKIIAVRKTRDVLIEVQHAEEGRSKLLSAIEEAVGMGGNMHELASSTVVEALDLDTTTIIKEIKDALGRTSGMQRQTS